MRYREKAFIEMKRWQRKMQQQPRFADRLAHAVQKKINGYIPEKVHTAITTALRQLVKGILFGSEYLNTATRCLDLEETEVHVRRLIKNFSHTAAIEGGITGAGGILLGFTDFPALLAIKFKLLFDIGTLYGYDMKDYRERVYLLYIFELAFSSRQHRRQVFGKIRNWNEKRSQLPEDINDFDWRSLQQEYRDYIDLAKMAQMVPVIGAAVGLVVNYKLTRQLGDTAINAYRMRILNEDFDL